jgi:hypothetical protein
VAGVFDEEIVRSYFELRGCFVRTNVPYRASAARDDGSDVDVVAVDPIQQVCVACEVKGWHTQPLTLSLLRDPQWRVFAFASESATAAVRELIGEHFALEHVLVMPPPGLRTDPNRLADEAAAHSVRLLFWPDLLAEMLSLVSERKNARAPVDHVVRVLRRYGMISDRSIVAQIE